MSATAGSLYFSEIAHFVPCSLCWWQRILIYPLAVIIPIGIIKKDRFIPLYILPFSVLGFLVALYQNALAYGWIPENLVACEIGIPCSVKYIDLFGFITIPFLSLAAFLIITVCAVTALRKGNYE